MELMDLTIPLGNPQAALTAIREAVCLHTAVCRPDTAKAAEAAVAKVIAVAAEAVTRVAVVVVAEAEAMGAAVTANVESCSVFGFQVARH